MPTHGSLTYKIIEGIYKNIFVLRCGHLSDLGDKLLNIYNTKEKINELFKFDAIRVVSETITKTKSHYGHNKQITESYKYIELNGDYNYFYKDDKWYVSVARAYEEKDIAFLEVNNAVTFKEGCFVLLTQDLIDNDFKLNKDLEPEGIKTEEEIIKLFNKYQHKEYKEFDRVLYKTHYNPKLCGLIKIEELCGDVYNLSVLNENDICPFLVINQKLPKTITTSDIKDLLRCGFTYGEFNKSLGNLLYLDLSWDTRVDMDNLPKDYDTGKPCPSCKGEDFTISFKNHKTTTCKQCNLLLARRRNDEY